MPYNDKCPVISGSRAVTGCVATAMAQVINYEKASGHVVAIPGYMTPNVNMPDLPAHDFDFGNLDNDEIATLMLYCGQSVYMDYGKDESGAAVTKIPDALRNYFGWPEEIRVLYREEYNDEHWNRMVSEEIASGHPLIYFGFSDNGNGGHQFVVDGVADGNMFHVNWGWEGEMDGYYSFQPFGDDNKPEFTLMQSMVSTRIDEPSNECITYGTTVEGINYDLRNDLTASVLQLKDGMKYRGDLVIPSHVQYEGKQYTVTHFDSHAFLNCRNLVSITIPSTITSQEWSVFENCENLHRVYIEDLESYILLNVGAYAEGSPLCYGADLYLNGELVTDLVIPEGITSISDYKFRNCTSIENVKFPSTLKELSWFAFAMCPNLKHIDTSVSSIKKLGRYAFMDCESLEEITLPATLNTMGGMAFGDDGWFSNGCKNLRKIISLATTPPWSVENNTFLEALYSSAVVYVPDESVSKYRQAKEWKMFADIRPLSAEKPIAETKTITYDNLIYEINLSENFAKVTGCEAGYHLVIPATVEYNGKTYPVEEIGYRGLFSSTISRIEAPLKRIGIKSFLFCLFLEKCELPSTLTYIPSYAFPVSTIPYLVLSEGITEIAPRAFRHEEGVDDMDAKIETIESRNPIPPVISDDSFGPLVYEITPLLVPYGSKKAYLSAPGWRNFKNISNIGDEQEALTNHDVTLSASFASGLNTIRNGMSLNTTVHVRNSGTEEITGFILSWVIDGKSVGQREYDVTLSVNEDFQCRENIVADVESTGIHDLTFYVALIGAEDTDLSDNSAILSFETFDKGFYRISLMEQFTSEYCSYSSILAHNVDNAIEKSGYSDFVAHINHHAGFIDDFLSIKPDYTWFYEDVSFTPAIMLNRNADAIPGRWSTPAQEMVDDIEHHIINEAGLCNAHVRVDCEIENDKLKAKIMLEKEDEFDMNAGYDYLTVMIIEDNIPARQQIDPWTEGILTDFIHHNNLRKVLSYEWGDGINWKDNLCAMKYETAIDPDWNADNLKVVAFIHKYDPESNINSQVYTAGASYLPQYGKEFDEKYIHVKLHDIALSATVNDAIHNIPILKQGQVINHGTENVNGFILSWTIDNETSGEKYFDEVIPPGESYIIREKIYAPDIDDHVIDHKLKLTVRFDGLQDESFSDNTLVLHYSTCDDFNRISLLEHFATESCATWPEQDKKVETVLRDTGCEDRWVRVVYHCGGEDDFLTLGHDYEWFYYPEANGTPYAPAMMINRSWFEGVPHLSAVGPMPDDIASIMDYEQNWCEYLVSVDCKIKNNKVIAEIMLENNNRPSPNIYLTAFILEDKILARAQMDATTGGVRTDFMHNNVLRKVLSNTWGDEIHWVGDDCAFKYETELDPEWNPDNIKVVAFMHYYNCYPIDCTIMTAGSSELHYFGKPFDESLVHQSMLNSAYTEENMFDIYNMMGVKVKTKAKDFSGLQPGLYICNGKKVLVK